VKKVSILFSENICLYITNNEIRYQIPKEQVKDRHNPFKYLCRAIHRLANFVSAETQQERNSVLLQSQRQLNHLFDIFYTERTPASEKPAQSKLASNFFWDGQNNTIQPTTIVVHKTQDDYRVKYQNGFHAEDETLTIETNTNDTDEDLRKAQIRYCSDGIRHQHHPSWKRSIAWRKRKPSAIRFSIQQTQNNNLKLGISSIPPSPPLWFRVLKYVPLYTEYAYVTFDIEKQAPVVKHLYNRRIANE
jgi:hypothetical protein